MTQAEKVEELLRHFKVFVGTVDQDVMAEMQSQPQVFMEMIVLVEALNGTTVQITRTRTLQKSA
jgi:hypothetical protein